jgi:hypothetical protein
MAAQAPNMKQGFDECAAKKQPLPASMFSHVQRWQMLCCFELA